MIDTKINSKSKSIVKEYLNELNNIKNESEMTICIRAIIPFMLVKLLGFMDGWLTYNDKSEYSLKRFDIKMNDSKGNRLIIEVKRTDKKLPEYIEQLVTYIHSQGIRYGILTNGYQWILIDDDIKQYTLYDKVVLTINMEERNNSYTLNMLKYLSYHFLFENGGITSYYSLIAQFKVYQYKGNKTAWKNYESTLIVFFRFLYKKHNSFIDVQKLQKSEFIAFFKWYATTPSQSKKGKNIKSGKISISTVQNLFNYINCFYTKLYTNGIFQIHPLKNINIALISDSINNYLLSNNNSHIEDVSKDTINEVYSIISSRLHKERNDLIFSLFLFGLSRKDICNLTVDDFIPPYLYAGAERRIIELDKPLCNKFETYLLFREKKSIKSKWLICKSKNERLPEKYISTVMNRILKDFSGLTIEKLHNYTVKTLIYNTKDPFTTSLITGLDTSTLCSLVKKEDVLTLGKIDKHYMQNHPFADFI